MKNIKGNMKTWRRMMGYAFHYKKLITMLIIVLTVVAAIDVLYPLLTSYVIDNFVSKGTTDGMAAFGVFYALIVIVQGVGVFFFVSGAGKMETRIARDIRGAGFERLQRLPLSYYDKTAAGYIHARLLSDVGRLSDLIAWSFVDIFWALFFVLGVMISMFSLNSALAAIALAIMIPLSLVTVYFQKKILAHQRNVRKHNSRITRGFSEGLLGAITTKTLACEDDSLNRFEGETTDMHKVSVRAALVNAVFMPIVMMLGSIGTALVLYVGGNASVGGIIGLGTLAAFISYSAQLFDPINQMARILSELQSALASAERVLALIDTPISVTDSKEVISKYGEMDAPNRQGWPKLYGDVEFRNVSFSYVPGNDIVKNLSFTVKRGETIALVGETGAGKTTIINLVSRFYEPTSGEILIDGVDYKERPLLWLYENMGSVMQTPHLFSGTIADNIRYGKKDATNDQVVAAARLAHADGLIMRQERGYETEVGEGGILLSTGEKQLISLARVIVKNPSLFVLDEATSSVDTKTEELVSSAIVDVMRSRTCFIVAHRLSTIVAADRILVIDGGVIKEDGNHEALMAARGMYYDLYSKQFGAS